MNIRKADLKELCMGPCEPYTAVWQSIMSSQCCYVARDREDNLLAIFGLGDTQIEVNGTKATPVWMLGTEFAYRHNKALVYYGKQRCTEWCNKVGTLCNYIWCGNEPAIRYIQHLGATLFDVVPMGKRGEQFVPFILSEVRV
jgi:hypothetical protein